MKAVVGIWFAIALIWLPCLAACVAFGCFAFAAAMEAFARGGEIDVGFGFLSLYCVGWFAYCAIGGSIDIVGSAIRFTKEELARQ